MRRSRRRDRDDATARSSASIAGIEGFTVGQRKGLGVALGERKFVVRIEPETRRVVIGDRTELNRSELTARDVQLAGV